MCVRARSSFLACAFRIKLLLCSNSHSPSVSVDKGQNMFLCTHKAPSTSFYSSSSPSRTKKEKNSISFRQHNWRLRELRLFEPFSGLWLKPFCDIFRTGVDVSKKKLGQLHSEILIIFLTRRRQQKHLEAFLASFIFFCYVGSERMKRSKINIFVAQGNCTIILRLCLTLIKPSDIHTCTWCGPESQFFSHCRSCTFSRHFESPRARADDDTMEL